MSSFVMPDLCILPLGSLSFTLDGSTDIFDVFRDVMVPVFTEFLKTFDRWFLRWRPGDHLTASHGAVSGEATMR